MGLITNEWRLKVLALVLAVLMLGAVAFSQNQPTVKSLSVPLSYSVKDGLVIINPPPKTTVFVQGLADALSRVSTDNTIASVDATNVNPGQAVNVKIRARTTVPGVTVQQPPPINVFVDTRAVKEVPVQVVVRAAPGWSVTKAVATCPGSSTPTPCAVHFSGPVSWETNLTARTVLSSTISVGELDSPNQLIQLTNSAGALNLSAVNTIPTASVDATSVNVHVEAQTGSTSTTVPLVDSPPSAGPPAGYRITAVSISPATVVLTGDIAVLGRISSIILPAVDLSDVTSTTTFSVSIPYRTGVTGSVATASLKYTISKNPNVTGQS
jgi:YbbR domain-containing protein